LEDQGQLTAEIEQLIFVGGPEAASAGYRLKEFLKDS
jgi:hypothetical protein